MLPESTCIEFGRVCVGSFSFIGRLYLRLFGLVRTA